MQGFESWYESKEHLIYGAMKQLRIFRDHDEYYQIGLCTLWRCSTRFDEQKGHFDSYAYNCILNQMKNHM